MKITTVNAVAVEGIHYHKDETYEVPQAVADALIAQGDAFDTANPPVVIEEVTVEKNSVSSRKPKNQREKE